jgi:hypothetical protein
MKLAFLLVLLSVAYADDETCIHQPNSREITLSLPLDLHEQFEAFKAQTEAFNAQTEAQLQSHRDALAGIILIMRTYLTSAALVDRVTLNFHQNYPDSPAQKMYESDMAFAKAKRQKESEEALARAQAYWDELCKHDEPPERTEPSVFWQHCKGLIEVDGKLVPISELED